jgi:hypothetical protein
MPLLDHFRPPLSLRRHWESFHGFWAAAAAGWLNAGRLPPGFFAEMQLHVGSRVEIDVPTFREGANGAAASTAGSGGGTATLTAPPWAPPEPAAVLPAIFPDELEVLVFNEEGGPTLVAALELVSPGNKDRDAARQAFVAKCASYLQQGIGLVVVDVVTVRLVNLHNDLMRFLGDTGAAALPADAPLYAAAYRPARRKDADQIDIWPVPLALGQPLPVMPLGLRGYGCVPLDLETCYTEARQRLVLD